MRHDHLDRSATIYAMVVGIVAGVVTLIVALGPVVGGAVSLGLALPCLAFIRRKREPCSQLDLTAVDSIRFDYAKRADLQAIVALDLDAFPQADIIPVETFLEWYERNGKLFICMFEDNAVAGYFAILPLRDHALERFLAGEMTEAELTSDDILTASEALRSETLYFFSIVVGERHRKLALALFQRVAQEIEHYRRKGMLKNVYATAATEAGKRLLRRFKFRLLQAADQRQDAHDLFVKPIDRIVDVRDYMSRRVG